MTRILHTLFLLGAIVIKSQAQDPTLTIRAGLPAGAGVQQVVYGNGIYLLATMYPTILYKSTNGNNWSRVDSFNLGADTGLSLYQNPAMVFGAGLFVMVADSGRIISSPDGVSWTRHSSGTMATLTSVEYLDSTFYAVGDSATLLSSPDGANWTRLHIGIGQSSDTYTNILYGNGVFVIPALIANANGNNYNYRSTSGIGGPWTADTIPPIEQGMIRFMRGYFYNMNAHSKISYDAHTWFELAYQGNYGTVSGNDGFTDGSRVYITTSSYVSGSPGVIVYSEPDGKTFDSVAEVYTSASHGACLNQQYFVYSTEGIAQSTDGMHYNVIGNGGYTAATNGSNFVKAGYNVQESVIYTSPDFTNWTGRDTVAWSISALSGPVSSPQPNAVRNVIYGGTQYWAIANVNYTSPDGSVWTNAGTPTLNTYGTPYFTTPNTIAYGGGLYMACAGYVWYSADGLSWTQSVTPFLGLNTKYPFEITASSVWYINGQFFFAAFNQGSGYGFMTTPDGVNYKLGQIGSTTGFNVATIDDIVYNPDSSRYYFFGTGNNGTGPNAMFCASTSDPFDSTLMINNNVNVTGLPSGAVPVDASPGYRFAYSNGHFVGISDAANTAQGGPYNINYLIWSTDGQNWNAHSLNGYTETNSISAKGDTFYIEGTSNYEIIARFSPAGRPDSVADFNAVLQSNRSVLLTWETADEKNSQDFTIQRSANEDRWDSIGERPAAGNSSLPLQYNFTDNSPLTGNNYYRLILHNTDGTELISPVRRVYVNPPEEILVFPNPARDFLLIACFPAIRGSVSLYDASGRSMLQQDFDGFTVTLSLRNLRPGVYHLVIRQQDGEQYQQEILHVN